jgi:hypothetical protein
MIYEYVFTAHDSNLISGSDEQEMWVDIFEEGHATSYSHNDFCMPDIRYACKQTYIESTDIFFQHCKITFIFLDLVKMREFFAGIGADNRRSLRHLGVQYHTLGGDGNVREDLDPEYWCAVAEVVENSFGDDNVMLETLEFETSDLRNNGVRFGGTPETDPRLTPVASTVRIIKLAQFFPRLTRLVLEEVVLLQPEDEEAECPLGKLPIVNFTRRRQWAQKRTRRLQG